MYALITITIGKLLRGVALKTCGEKEEYYFTAAIISSA